MAAPWLPRSSNTNLQLNAGTSNFDSIMAPGFTLPNTSTFATKWFWIKSSLNSNVLYIRLVRLSVSMYVRMYVCKSREVALGRIVDSKEVKTAVSFRFDPIFVLSASRTPRPGFRRSAESEHNEFLYPFGFTLLS